LGSRENRLDRLPALVDGRTKNGGDNDPGRARPPGGKSGKASIRQAEAGQTWPLSTLNHNEFS
jgi:hypothetical protein